MKHIFQTIMGTAFCALLLMACKNDVAVVKEVTVLSTDSLKTIIMANNNIYSQAISKNDSAGFVNCYTDSCCLFVANAPEFCGKAGVGKFYTIMHQMGASGLTLSTREVYGGNEFATEVGSYAINIATGKVVDKGKYMVLWKNVGGKWKIDRDIFNTDMPLSTAK